MQFIEGVKVLYRPSKSTRPFQCEERGSRWGKGRQRGGHYFGTLLRNYGLVRHETNKQLQRSKNLECSQNLKLNISESNCVFLLSSNDLSLIKFYDPFPSPIWRTHNFTHMHT